MCMKISNVLILLIFILGALEIGAQEKLQVKESQFDKVFEDWVGDEDPGISIAVLNDGKLEFQKSWGMANVEFQIPIDKETVFLFPLMSDQMMAFSILLLEEQGQLSLDEKIGETLDFLPTPLNDISLHQLLHHNSCLNDLAVIKIMSGWISQSDISEVEFLNLLNSDLAAKENHSESYKYNRAELRLLQMVLEKKTKMSFAEFAQKEIFEPLGMTNTQIAQRNQSIKNKATGYIKEQAGFKVDIKGDNYLICDQVYTTASDICFWTDNFWRPRIGSAAIWSKMDEYVLDQGKPLEEKNLSLFVGQHQFWDYRGLPKYYQIGIDGGYAAKMIRYPEYDLAVVVLGNFQQYNGHLATGASELYLEPFFDKEQASSEKPKSIQVSKKELKQYCGTFWNYKDESLVKVDLENDTLRYFEEKFNWRADLLPIGDNEFFIDQRAGYYLTLNKNSEGKDLVLKTPSGNIVEFSPIEMNENEVDAETYEGLYHSDALRVQYEIVTNEDGIQLKSKRGLSIDFTPINKDAFKSNHGQFTRLQFIRNESGIVDAVEISNSSIKNVSFNKRKSI